MSISTRDVLNTTFIDITQINFLLAECYALNKAIENSALPPTFIEGKEILNMPEHIHPSNFVSRYAQILDKQNYLQEVGGIMKL